MIERYMPYLNYLNKNVFITDLDTVFKYSSNVLLIKDVYEFNHYKEDLKYLVNETLVNDGLYQYVLSNMRNSNYIFAVSITLIKDKNVVGTISLTKKTYAQAISKLMNNSFTDTMKMRAALILNYVTMEECYKRNAGLTTTVTYKNGNKLSIDNTTLIDLLQSNEFESKTITSRINYDNNTLNLLMLTFVATGVLKKYIFNSEAYSKEDILRKIDISEIVVEQNEQPKMMLNTRVQEQLFKYAEKTYSDFELLFHIYKRSQELEFSIQSLAYIAQTLGLNYKYTGGVLQVYSPECGLEYSKERFRILTSQDSVRTKIYQLEEKIIENINKNKTTETKLFNNIAYYKNFYLKDGVSDKDKLISFLRIISSIKEYRTDFITYVKFLFKKVLGGEDYKLYVITNNVKNKELEKVIPITIVKTEDTYYVVDPSMNVRVANYKDINNYLSAKEYYSNLFEGKCDILC